MTLTPKQRDDLRALLFPRYDRVTLIERSRVDSFIDDIVRIVSEYSREDEIPALEERIAELELQLADAKNAQKDDNETV
jgi:cell division septum initiation protein DivIVA